MQNAYDQVEQRPPFDLAALLWAVWAGRWHMLICMVMITGSATYYAFRVATPAYQASAVVALDFGGGEHSEATLNDPTLNARISALTARPVLVETTQRLQLLADPQFNRYLQETPAYSLSQLRQNARHFLSGTTAPPKTEAAIREKTLENLRNVLSVQHLPDTWMVKITARASSENQAIALVNVVSEIAIQHASDTQHSDNLREIAWLEARIQSLDAEMLANDAQISSLIATAQFQRNDGLDNLSAQVVDTDQRIEQIEQTLVRLEQDTLPSPRRDAQIEQTKAQLDALTTSRNQLNEELSEQSQGLAVLQALQRDADVLRALHQDFLIQRQAARLNMGLARAPLERMTPATTAQYLGPQKIRILQIAAVVAVGVAGVLIALQNTLSPKALTTSQLTNYTGLPARALPLRKSARAEVIVSSLLTNGTDKIPKVIGITHASAGKANQTICKALADFLVNQGRSVLIIETQKTSTAPAHIRSLANQPNSDVPALTIAHGWPMRLADFDGPKLSEWLDPAKTRFDHIIISGITAPHDPIQRLWAQQADTLVIVAQRNKTPVRTITEGLSQLSPNAHLFLSPT